MLQRAPDARGLGAGSCCIELPPLRKGSYFLICSLTPKSCSIGRESSVVHCRQPKVLVQPFWGELRGWGAVLGRGLCLQVPVSRGNTAPMMGLVLLCSALRSSGANTHVSLRFPPRDGQEQQRWGHGGPAQEPPPAGGECFGGCWPPSERRGGGCCQWPALWMVNIATLL